MLVQEPVDAFRVANVAVDKLVIRMILYFPEIVGIAGICKLVQVYDAVTSRDSLQDEAASDESGPAGYQQCFRHIDKPSGLIVDVEKRDLTEEINTRVACSSLPDPEERNAAEQTYPAVMLLQERIFSLSNAANK